MRVKVIDNRRLHFVYNSIIFSNNREFLEHRYYNHDNSSFVFSERILCFYDAVRHDGLSEIHMYPFRLTQYYVNREDLLYYR